MKRKYLTDDTEEMGASVMEGVRTEESLVSEPEPGLEHLEKTL